MGQPAELFDTLPLDFEDHRVAAPLRPMGAGRAFAVWVALSLGGWGLIAAIVGYMTL